MWAESCQRAVVTVLEVAVYVNKAVDNSQSHVAAVRQDEADTPKQPSQPIGKQQEGGR